MSKRTKQKRRQYTIKLDDDIVEFVLDITNVDGVAPAVRAALRKMMKDEARNG